ncbi:MAG: helix-turn-helix domain-containing protein [Bacteroidia bacterium]
MKKSQDQPLASVAVLPFSNLSVSEENQYFCDGITEDIINALAKLKELKVISPTSSSVFKNSIEDIASIAEKLKVTLILKGSVRLSASTMRISVQLIEVATNTLLWTENWDRKVENVFVIQDEISLLVADSIRERLGHIEIEEHLIERLNANPKAYDFYLKGNYHIRKWNAEDVNKAIEYFEKAAALDPNDIKPYLGLADAYSFLAVAGFAPRAQAWLKSVENIEMAKSIDANNASLNHMLANQKFFTEADYAGAFKYAKKAIAVKPNYAESQQFLCFLYALKKDFEKSYKHLMYAKSIDPLNFETKFYEAYYYYKREDLDQAFHLIEELIAENPKSLPAALIHLFILIGQKKLDLAENALNKMAIEEITPDERKGLNCFIYAHKHNKRHDSLIDLEQSGIDPLAHHAHTYLFLVYATLGEYNDAFTVFEKVFTQKSSVLLLYLNDPLVSKLSAQKSYTSMHQRAFPELVDDEPKKKRSSAIDANKAKELSELLVQFVESNQPFLNPALNLRSLAADINVNANQLSWLLNEFLGVSFSHFINSYRIEHFKKLILDENNAHISIIGLAFESGFSSKTVFNTSFKKIEGITPKQYQMANSKK